MNIITENTVFGNFKTTGKYRVLNERLLYEVVCICGEIREHPASNLRRNKPKSCGCTKNMSIALARTKHGFAKRGSKHHDLYGVWVSMKQRCYDENASSYKNYGAIGVSVYEGWVNDFMCFYEWAIKNGYKKGLHIDKDKLSPFKTGIIYSPDFCCFLTVKENMQHRRNTLLIKYRGELKSMIEWCDIKNMDYKLVHERLRYGWAVEDAFETPVRKRKIA